MPIFVGLCCLGYNLFYILIGCLYYNVHLRSVGYRVMVLDLEPSAHLRYHIIVQIEIVVKYDSF